MRFTVSLCVVTWPGDEVDAGARGGEHPAVVVERPDLLLQRLHDLRLELCGGTRQTNSTA